MLVWDDAGQRDVMLMHEVGDEFGGAVGRRAAGASGVLTHFDADRVTIARAIIVGMLSLFVVWETLVD